MAEAGLFLYTCFTAIQLGLLIGIVNLPCVSLGSLDPIKRSSYFPLHLSDPVNTMSLWSKKHCLIMLFLCISVALSIHHWLTLYWEEGKIKTTAAILSPFALRQIGPSSNRDLIYQAKSTYWNCPTGYKSDPWTSLYLTQGRHHSVVAGRGGTSPSESLSLLMDVAHLTSQWPGATGWRPNLFNLHLVWLHVHVTLKICLCLAKSWHTAAVCFSPFFLSVNSRFTCLLLFLSFPSPLFY